MSGIPQKPPYSAATRGSANRPAAPPKKWKRLPSRDHQGAVPRLEARGGDRPQRALARKPASTELLKALYLHLKRREFVKPADEFDLLADHLFIGRPH